MAAGGTFTDIICTDNNNRVRTMKLLSEDPNNYKDAPTEGIRRIIEEECGEALDANGLIKTDNIGEARS